MAHTSRACPTPKQSQAPAKADSSLTPTLCLLCHPTRPLSDITIAILPLSVPQTPPLPGRLPASQPGMTALIWAPETLRYTVLQSVYTFPWVL